MKRNYDKIKVPLKWKPTDEFSFVAHHGAIMSWNALKRLTSSVFSTESKNAIICCFIKHLAAELFFLLTYR